MRQDPLDTFRAADRAYQDALAEAETLKRARDEALLGASRSGKSVRELAGGTGLSPGRVQQMLARARGAESSGQ